MNYLTGSNICYRCQSEFHKNQATDFSLSYLRDEISAGFDSVLFTGMILVDLHKTFETTNHEILLKECLLLDFLINQWIDLNLE